MISLKTLETTNSTWLCVASTNLRQDLPGNNNDLDRLQWYVTHNATKDPSPCSFNFR